MHKHWGRIQKEAAKEPGTKLVGPKRILKDKHKLKDENDKKHALSDSETKDESAVPVKNRHENVQNVRDVDRNEDSKTSRSKNSGENNRVTGMGDQPDPVLHVPITQYVTEETDLLQLLRDNFPVITKQESPGHNCDHNEMCHKHKEIDMTIDHSSPGCGDMRMCNTSAAEVIVEKSDENISLDPDATCIEATGTLEAPVPTSDALMLTGLHTCGNLAPSIFRIFLANPSAMIMCNVGCCYQHLDEEFWSQSEAKEGEFLVNKRRASTINHRNFSGFWSATLLKKNLI